MNEHLPICKSSNGFKSEFMEKIKKIVTHPPYPETYDNLIIAIKKLITLTHHNEIQGQVSKTTNYNDIFIYHTNVPIHEDGQMMYIIIYRISNNREAEFLNILY